MIVLSCNYDFILFKLPFYIVLRATEGHFVVPIAYGTAWFYLYAPKRLKVCTTHSNSVIGLEKNKINLNVNLFLLRWNRTPFTVYNSF